MNDQATHYGRARSVFGCRVKRVCFKLNPFLERTNVKADEYGVYQPSSKFALALQSIVLCEDLSSDSTPHWQALSPAAFWDYLYSSSWGEGCTLRVMEGELLELLLTTLFAMERDQLVASHNTFAYTINTRIKPFCFQDEESPRTETINETLLVDFTYYGKRTEEMEMEFSGSTAYPFSLTSSRGFSSSEYTSTSLESSEGAMTLVKPPPPRPAIQDPELLEGNQRGGDFAVRLPKSVKCDTKNIRIVDSGLLGIKGPLRAIPVTVLAHASPFDSSGSMLIRSFIKESSQLLLKSKTSIHHSRDNSSEQDRASPTQGRSRKASVQQSKMPTLFEGKGKRQTSTGPDAAPGGSQASESTIDSNSDSPDSCLRLLEFNLAKLPCSERTKASLQNWQLEKYGYIRRPPGDEYYLREVDPNLEHLPPREILLRHKRRMQEERESKRKEMEERKKFLEKKATTLIKYKDTKPIKPVIRFFTHTPSFAEFYRWLGEENKFDPRYKKHKQRKKRIVKKYKMKTSETGLAQMESFTTSGSSVRRSTIGTESSVMEDISPGFGRGKGSSKINFNYRMSLPVADSSITRFAEEVGGVTDSPAIKNGIIGTARMQAEAEEEVSPLGGHASRQARPKRTPVSADPSNRGASIGTEPSNRVSSVSGEQGNVQSHVMSDHKEKKQKNLVVSSKTPNSSASSPSGQRGSSSASSQKTSRSGSGSKSGGSLFRKNDFKMQRELDLETESSDTESSEEDELEDSLFDANKINKRYSFEKMRGKNYHKKKPVFDDILKKYYRVQNVMAALKGQSGNISSMNTTAAKKPGRKQPMAGMLRRLSRPIKAKTEITLGKIKTFRFQQYKNHKPKVPEVILPDFTTYPTKEFVVNLEKALDDFVVRKENVISSYGLEKLTTVTFTRPGAFTKMVHVE